MSNVTTFDKNLTIEASADNLTINDNVKAGVVKAKTLSIKGLVNDLAFNQIVDDTVTKDTNRVIGGHKHFNNLTTNTIKVENRVYIDQIPDKIDELRLDGPLNIKKIKIDNLYFDNKCNQVDKVDFDGFDGSTNGTIVTGDQNLDTVTIYGHTFIKSNKIGNTRIDDLVDNSVKLDEPHEFNFANFGNF